MDFEGFLVGILVGLLVPYVLPKITEVLKGKKSEAVP